MNEDDQPTVEGSSAVVSSAQFADNLSAVHRRIAAAGGDPSTVKVIAVSKGQPVEAVQAALAAGHRLFGENYADELVTKAQSLEHLDPQPVWHFQGRLQTNKINRLKPYVAVWQTVDSAERADALAVRVPGANVFIQIDSSGGTGGRSGVLIAEVGSLVHHAIDRGLVVLGLMTVAPLVDGQPSSVAASRAFHALADEADRLHLPERSMGMSGDLDEAIAAGATIIRVGAALFGNRR